MACPQWARQLGRLVAVARGDGVVAVYDADQAQQPPQHRKPCKVRLFAALAALKQYRAGSETLPGPASPSWHREICIDDCPCRRESKQGQMASARQERQESPGTETAAVLCLLWGQTPEGTDQALAACESLNLYHNSLIWLVLHRT